jgi:hypothetical protein
MSDLLELIKFRTSLITTIAALEPSPMSDNIHQLKILRDDMNAGEYSQIVDRKIDSFVLLNQNNQALINDLKNLLKTTESNIDTLADELLTIPALEDKFKYDNVRVKPNNYYHKEYLDDEIIGMVQNRIYLYSNHLYAGLILGCRFREWLPPLVASDPLYLTNYDNKDLIEQIISEYPEIYQRRVRIYQIADQDYSILPQQQFSIILSWDYLLWIHAKEFEKCLAQAFDLLRPGGTFIFGYNNCDLLPSAEKALNGSRGWASRHRLIQLAEQIGYEVVSTTDHPVDDPTVCYVSWAELKRPGELKTAKMRPAMGEIKSK